MIDWSAIEPGLCALVLARTGIVCVHEDGAEPFIPPGAACIAKFSIFAVTPVGVDELRMIEHVGEPIWDGPWGGDDPKLREHALGVRELTWRIRFEAYDATAGRAAQQHTEKLRDQMSLTSTRAELKALGLSYLSTLATGYVPQRKDQRQRPFAFLDLRLGASGAFLDSTEYTTIETVSTRFIPWV